MRERNHGQRGGSRYCTYRQALGYIWNHTEYLTAEDGRRIFRENTLELLAPDRPAAGAR